MMISKRLLEELLSGIEQREDFFGDNGLDEEAEGSIDGAFAWALN